MTTLQQLKAESFSEFILSHRYCAILFWASWEGIHPLIEKLLANDIASEMRNKIAFAGFDTDPVENWDIVRKHREKSLPFLAFYRDGNHVSTLVGVRRPKEMDRILRDFIVEQFA